VWDFDEAKIMQKGRDKYCAGLSSYRLEAMEFLGMAESLLVHFALLALRLPAFSK
jgi:hypothetical protein